MLTLEHVGIDRGMLRESVDHSSEQDIEPTDSSKTGSRLLNTSGSFQRTIGGMSTKRIFDPRDEADSLGHSNSALLRGIRELSSFHGPVNRQGAAP